MNWDLWEETRTKLEAISFMKNFPFVYEMQLNLCSDIHRDLELYLKNDPYKLIDTLGIEAPSYSKEIDKLTYSLTYHIIAGRKIVPPFIQTLEFNRLHIINDYIYVGYLKYPLEAHDIILTIQDYIKKSISILTKGDTCTPGIRPSSLEVASLPSQSRTLRGTITGSKRSLTAADILSITQKMAQQKCIVDALVTLPAYQF